MVKNKVIELAGLEPYTPIEEVLHTKKYPYASCIHNTFLTLFNYFNIDESGIIMNSEFFYMIRDCDKFYKSQLVMAAKNYKSIEKLCNELSISLYGASPNTSELKDVILNELLKGFPIIFRFDVFYQKMRTQYYQHEHGIHMLIIYGFDIEKDEVYIIDDIKGCNKYIVSYSELVECKDGLFEHLNFGASGMDYLYSFQYDETQRHTINNFSSKAKLSLPNIMQNDYVSMSKIGEFIEEYEKQGQKNPVLYDLGGNVWKRYSKLYQLKFILPENDKRSNKYNIALNVGKEIATSWNKIHLLNMKAPISNRIDISLFNQNLLLLKKINELELLSYDTIYN